MGFLRFWFPVCFFWDFLLFGSVDIQHFTIRKQILKKNITLGEVTVKAAKVVNKSDGMIIYPTDAQKQASNNGYSILEKLTLANLRIDNINHTVTAIDNRGGVQLRVNGIVAGKQEMLALNPKDIYFFRQITPRQSVTANAVGTYISTQTSNYYDEGNPYRYDVDGKTSSLLAEIIYENRLKPFTLSAGGNYSYKHSKNDYSGDASSLTKTSNNRLYAFAEIKGTMRKLRYTLGAGASYIHYTQNGHRYDFQTFHPKVSLTYDINNSMQLSYTCQMQDKVSRIAMTSDVMVRTNSMEWTAGNPDLKPSHDMDHRLQFSYNTSRLQTFVEGYYKQCLKPNMAHYERTADNQFIYTQKNQKEIDVLNVMAYAGYWILPEKLQVAANGGVSRCFNFGNDYTHCYTSWFYACSITAYLGNITLQGYADNGNRFLEGESKGYNAAYSVLKASYTWRNWQFSLSWANPLNNNYKAYENELLNRNLYKHTVGYSKGNGNQVSLNVSWRLSRGSKHNSAEKRISLSDADNGIL